MFWCITFNDDFLFLIRFSHLLIIFSDARHFDIPELHEPTMQSSNQAGSSTALTTKRIYDFRLFCAKNLKTNFSSF